MNPRAERGLTVVELLVAMTMSTIVFAMTLQVYEASTRQIARNERTTDAASRARAGMDRVARTLRDASGWSAASASSTPVLVRAQPLDVVFRRVRPGTAGTTANPRSMETLRFCVEGGVLYEQRGSVDAVPGTACPDPAWTQSAVVTGVRNGSGTPLFAFDTASTGTTTVGIELSVDADPEAPPGPQSLRGGVQLRNQNQAPTATFTVVPAAGRHLQLNASASVDPEAQLLDFTWTDEGTPATTRQPDARPVVDYIAPAPGPRTITLTVTDPGKLSRTVSQTVTVLP